ncbi:MAG: hypothetical protein K6E32_07080 [Lachnospiraceae bacterium]|nr:hypothetical protein [Lachnospiraceae bacterium]
MIVAKKSKVGLIFTIVSILFLLLGLLDPGEFVAFLIIGVVILIIGICIMVSTGKQFKKKQAALERLNADGTVDRLNSEISSGRTKYYKKLALAVNDREVFIDGPDAELVKMEEIARVYRTNVIRGQYNYQNQAIDLDLKDGRRYYVGTVTRKNVPAEYGEVLNYIRVRVTAALEGGI